MKNTITILYGSLNSVPSPEGIAPAKVIVETVEQLKSAHRITVLSNYHPKLDEMEYDRSVYRHVQPDTVDRLLLMILKLFLNYQKRKARFVTANDKTLLYYIAAARRVAAERAQYAVVHVSPGLVSMLRLLAPKVELVFYHHGTSLHTKLSEQQWQRLLTQSPRGIISVNKAAFELANQTFKTQIPADKSFTIYNGISQTYDPATVAQIKNEKRADMGMDANNFVFIFTGRVCEEKGVLKLLQAFHRLCRELEEKKVQLFIVGGAGGVGLVDKATVYLLQCKDYVAQHDLPVQFTGFLSGEALWQTIACADVGILSTDKTLSLEGIPLSILEFLSMGKPVISTKVGGLPEVIEDGVNGFLIDEYPFQEQMAYKMQEIMQSEQYQELSENAYKTYSARFTVDKMTAQFLATMQTMKLVEAPPNE